jgi:hypothetical protein
MASSLPFDAVVALESGEVATVTLLDPVLTTIADEPLWRVAAANPDPSMLWVGIRVSGSGGLALPGLFTGGRLFYTEEVDDGFVVREAYMPDRFVAKEAPAAIVRLVGVFVPRP